MKLATMLRRTTRILRRMTTILSGVLDCSFILSGGRVTEGNMGTLVFVCRQLETKFPRASIWTLRRSSNWSCQKSIVHTADSSTKWLAFHIG